MKPLAIQTPKPSSNRSRFKETPQSKRSETGSNDPKILARSSSSNLSDFSEKEASDSSSSKVKQQKLVSKSLNLEFEAVSEDVPVSTLDPPLFLPDLESSAGDQELTSWMSPQSAISSEIVQGGVGSGKIVVSVESNDAAVVTDLLKESILEFNSSSKLLDSLCADLSREEKKTDRWSDRIFLMKLQAGLSLFLILTVAMSSLMVASGAFAGDEEWSFTGLYPT